MLRGVHHQSAPAAADVEQALAGLEPQLAAQDVQFLLLGGIQVVIAEWKYAQE